jgi:hypothetical protein
VNKELNEKIFHSTVNLTYYFERHEESEFLIVVFSAMNPENQFAYNYIQTLEHLKCNKLFILDSFGKQGCYYLGNNRDFSVETSVASLINYISRQCNVRMENIITVGSSKGGFAALYFGIKYNYGYIISGGPQTKLGDFLIDHLKNYEVTKYIAGDCSGEDKLYLNNIMYNIINDMVIQPNIFIHVGKGDYSYKNQVIPLINAFNDKKIKYSLDLQNYLRHDDLRQYFPPYIAKVISGITNISVEDFYPIQTTYCQINEDTLSIKCESIGEKLQYAYYIYKDGKVFKKIGYEYNNTLKYELSLKGSYKVKVFVKDTKNRKFIQTSNEVNYI